MTERILADFENIIGYVFKNKKILQKALTHVSYEFDNDNNQNLEFLGDSILNFIITEFLYNKYKTLDSGALTKIKANYVSKTPLAKSVKKFKLDKYLRLSKSLNINQMSIKSVSDLYEAIVGAIYLDSNNINDCLNFVNKTLVNADIVDDIFDYDYKSRLYEYASKKRVKIEFSITQSGKDHLPYFKCQLQVDNKVVSNAIGDTKLKSEQIASKKYLEKVNYEE